MLTSPWTLLWLLTAVLSSCHGASILGVCPTASISHQLPFLIIMKEMALRGHDVTVITTNPIQDAPQNMKQVDMSFCYNLLKDNQTQFIQATEEGPIPLLKLMASLGHEFCQHHLESPQLQQFMREEHQFDLVLMEQFFFLCHLGFLHQLGYPPLVGFSSLGLNAFGHWIIGNTINPAYMPDYFTEYSDHMSFWERFDNTYMSLQLIHIFNNLVLPPQDALIKKYFGPDVRSISEMLSNVSLTLVSNHFSVSYPVPNQPNVIELTGLHVRKERKPLPEDIQEFLDGAEHGVVYFSLGSNVRSNTLPEDKRTALLEAFASLPQRILWKWEDDVLPGQPPNVKVSKWLPQQDVLAHRNVRVFITQGGLQSFNEAAFHGVPFVAIPFFGDQRYNVAKMVRSGIGVRLDFKDITKESVVAAIRTVIEDPSYRDNMRRFSAVFREHQSESLERAVWWLEYVLRHRGAPHLRPATVSLRWWQLLLLDVAAAVLAAALVAALLVYLLLTRLLAAVSRGRKTKAD